MVQQAGGAALVQGIGLGLTLVALFAPANQGRLAIDRHHDRGTAIMLSLSSAAQTEIANIA